MEKEKSLGRGPLSPMNPWVQWIFSPSLEKGSSYWRYTHFALNREIMGASVNHGIVCQFRSLFLALNNFPSEVKKNVGFVSFFL